MAGSMNKACLIGNVGKDPEVRNTQDGRKIVNITLATEESWKDKASGERKSRTEWHRIVVFNSHIADVAERYVKKGSKIYIEGSLQTRKWTDQQGIERYSTEVVLAAFGGALILLTKQETGSAPAGQSRPAERRQDAGQSDGWNAPRGGGDLDDEIPFGACWQ